MSLHILSTVLISLSSNTDSLAIAVAYGIKKVKIPILPNLLIAVVSSLGTFVSMSVGEMIGGYLPKSIAGILGSGVLISIGIIGIWKTIQEEQRRLKRVKSDRQNIIMLATSSPNQLSEDKNSSNLVNRPQNILSGVRNRSKVISIKESIPLAFSLTINNIGGGVGAGMSGLSASLTTVINFILAILAILGGSALGGRFANKMTEYWAGFLSSGLIIMIGIYEYFN